MSYVCSVTYGTGFDTGVVKRIINSSSTLEAKIMFLHWLAEQPFLKEYSSFKFSVEYIESV